MLIELNNKEVTEPGRLGKCLDSGVIPVNDIRSFLTGLQQKINAAASPEGNKRNPVKVERKIKYATKLKAV